MKALLRTAAVLSFGFFFAGGLVIVRLACSSSHEDAIPIGAVGLFFIGTAFFVGPILLATAERLGGKGEAK